MGYIIIIIVIVVGYNIWKNSMVHDDRYKSKLKEDYKYRNHCYKCGTSIDSDRDKRCNICGWYHCSECDACGCDYH